VGGLTADDEEGREGRDAAESHFGWVFVCCRRGTGGVFTFGASSSPMLGLAVSSKL
jgi:hypothetical protein